MRCARAGERKRLRRNRNNATAPVRRKTHFEGSVAVYQFLDDASRNLAYRDAVARHVDRLDARARPFLRRRLDETGEARKPFPGGRKVLLRPIIGSIAEAATGILQCYKHRPAKHPALAQRSSGRQRTTMDLCRIRFVRESGGANHATMVIEHFRAGFGTKAERHKGLRNCFCDERFVVGYEQRARIGSFALEEEQGIATRLAILDNDDLAAQAVVRGLIEAGY